MLSDFHLLYNILF